MWLGDDVFENPTGSPEGELDIKNSSARADTINMSLRRLFLKTDIVAHLARADRDWTAVTLK